jgi:Tol biopolymer transport system component
MIRNFVSGGTARAGSFACAATALIAMGSTASAQVAVNRLGHGSLEFDAPTTAVVMAAGGKYVVVETAATNASVIDSNGMSDIFLIEVPTGYERMVSHVALAPGLDGGNGPSFNPSVSADGRWVVFSSDASDLVTGDSNGSRDIFLFDRDAVIGTPVTLVSVNTFGSSAGGASDFPSISDDGLHIAFDSLAPDLVSGDTNSVGDIFVRNLNNSSTVRVNIGVAGAQAISTSQRPAISGNGAYVAYESIATNLILGDNNGVSDVFVVPAGGGTSVIVSGVPGGAVGNSSSQNASISYLGDWIAFESNNNNLVSGEAAGDFDLDVFLYSRLFPSLQRPSSTPLGQGASDRSINARISRNSTGADGRYVAYQSKSDDLVSPQTSSLVKDEVFVFDRTTITGQPNSLQSVTPAGVLPNAISTLPSIGASPSFMSFLSADDAMVGGESSTGDVDAFLKQVPVTTPTTYGLGISNASGCTPTMHFAGSPSATSPNPFTVSCDQLPGHTMSNNFSQGYFFYSLQAPHNGPLYFFANGLPNGLLLARPAGVFRVGPPFSTGGTTMLCDGFASMDFNALIQSGSNPALTVGKQVWMQTYSRDNNVNPQTYSDALWFVIQP